MKMPILYKEVYRKAVWHINSAWDSIGERDCEDRFECGRKLLCLGDRILAGEVFYEMPAPKDMEA